jgi:hypothetical protein
MKKDYSGVSGLLTWVQAWVRQIKNGRPGAGGHRL